MNKILIIVCAVLKAFKNKSSLGVSVFCQQYHMTITQNYLLFQQALKLCMHTYSLMNLCIQFYHI